MSTPGQMTVQPFAEWGLGLDRPLLIAGPCSAEDRAQVLSTAHRITE